SAEPGPLAGRVHRRLGAGPAGPAGHAYRAPGRPGLAAAPRIGRGRARPGPPGTARVRPARPGDLPPPAPAARPAARRRDRPAPDAFPRPRLAREALRAGGTAPATLNAANEVAVSAFLQGRIGFLSIAALVEDALAAIAVEPAASLEALRGIDARARRHAERAIATGAIR